MPCLSGRFDPNIGPLVNVGVLPTSVFTTASSLSTQIMTFQALIDTGAGIACISANIVKSLNLQPLGKREMVSATQSVPMNLYLVDLFLPFGATGFLKQGAKVMEFSMEAGSQFQMILGRDMICQGILTMSFDGHFTFSL